MKTCQSCNRLLPLREFHRQTGMADGRQKVCRKCKNIKEIPTRQQQQELADATEAALKVHSLACLAKAFGAERADVRAWRNRGRYTASADKMAIRTGDMWDFAGMVGCWFGR